MKTIVKQLEIFDKQDNSIVVNFYDNGIRRGISIKRDEFDSNDESFCLESEEEIIKFCEELKQILRRWPHKPKFNPPRSE